MFVVLLSALLMFTNCTSLDREKSVLLLLETIGVNKELQKNAKCMVVLTQAGCSSCIERLRSSLTPSTDTIYVVVCRSAKEFFLLMEKDLDELPNAYIDKEGLSVKLGLAKAVPVFYMLKNGKYISHEPLLIRNNVEGELPVTDVLVDKPDVDLGQMSLGEEKYKTLIINNVGKNPLKISNVEMSCDCMEGIYEDRMVASKDTIHLNVRIRQESVGDFIREIFVYGNFVDAPLEITFRGTVKK